MSILKKFIPLCFILLFVGLFYYGDDFLYAENTVSDEVLLWETDLSSMNNIKLVLIDDKSLSKVGPCPWNRKIIASIIENLDNKKVG